MILIVDYGLGNLLSVFKAFEEVAGEKQVVVSRDPETLNEATHIVLPGVGNFRTGMKNLTDLNLLEQLRHQVIHNKKPFLGICLGMQLLAERGEEYGETKGLGWIPGRVSLIDNKVKLPHIGWNTLELCNTPSLFKDIARSRELYFVHSYYLDCPTEYIIATCTYGNKFAAAIQKDNIYATQFHPEKSRDTGLKILNNFLEHSC